MRNILTKKVLLSIIPFMLPASAAVGTIATGAVVSTAEILAVDSAGILTIEVVEGTIPLVEEASTMGKSILPVVEKEIGGIPKLPSVSKPPRLPLRDGVWLKSKVGVKYQKLIPYKGDAAIGAGVLTNTAYLPTSWINNLLYFDPNAPGDSNVNGLSTYIDSSRCSHDMVRTFPILFLLLI